MELFKGTYERFANENGEDVLKALNVNWLLRKAANVSTPVMKVTEENGVWTINTSTILKSMELKFRLGEQFDDTSPDGRQVTSVVTHDDDKLICVQKAKKEGEASTKSVRQFSDDGCVLTLTIDGIDDLVCVQRFKRI